MRTLGVILARAGSEGLPNKHLLPLHGRPVITYSFDHALASRHLNHTVVSSDCPQVLRLALDEGLATLKRPTELATRDAAVQDVLLHALHACERQGYPRVEAIVTIYGNVPVRPEGVIDEAIELLERTGCDSARSFCPVGKWHPAWMARLGGEDQTEVSALQPGSFHRRQDLEPLFLHDGAVVAVTRASLLRAEVHPTDPHAFFGVKRRAVQTAADETVEVDELRDLFRAEAVLRHRQDTARLRRISA